MKFLLILLCLLATKPVFAGAGCSAMTTVDEYEGLLPLPTIRSRALSLHKLAFDEETKEFHLKDFGKDDGKWEMLDRANVAEELKELNVEGVKSLLHSTKITIRLDKVDGIIKVLLQTRVDA